MNNIRKFREKKKYSQEYIARKMNVKVATVSRWETGKFLPRAKKLPQLANILNCTIGDLLGN